MLNQQPKAKMHRKDVAGKIRVVKMMKQQDTSVGQSTVSFKDELGGYVVQHGNDIYHVYNDDDAINLLLELNNADDPVPPQLPESEVNKPEPQGK